MTLTHSLITIAGGILAAASLVVAVIPKARPWIDRALPWQGAFGAGLFVWGAAMLLFKALPILGSLGTAPLAMLLYGGSIVVDLALGLRFGRPTLDRLGLTRHPRIARPANALRAHLARWQVPLGLAAIGSGLGLLLLQLP